VLITAGPTYEAIDPVRGITNLSSGKMGYAVARAAREAGAEVTLVSGPTALDTPHGVRRIDVQSAQQMLDAVMAGIHGQHVFIGVAAVADWRVEMPATRNSRRMAAARRSCSLRRTRTSSPPSPARPRSAAGRIAWASPPSRKT
jgi:phosphopantothenoylcysteine decarboxylase/phosphopantothenate--cysteine ligase